MFPLAALASWTCAASTNAWSHDYGIQRAADVNQQYYDMPVFAPLEKHFIFRKDETPAHLIVSEQCSMCRLN